MPSIADLIRREIARSPDSLNALAQTVGILQPSLWRFVHEKVDPKLEAAEKLLDYFGYAVVKKRAPANQLSTGESSKRSKQTGKAKPRRRA
jgi:predicted transcriptional regulator